MLVSEFVNTEIFYEIINIQFWLGNSNLLLYCDFSRATRRIGEPTFGCTKNQDSISSIVVQHLNAII